jgi:hypothetical protein
MKRTQDTNVAFHFVHQFAPWFTRKTSSAEPHHFYAAPGKKFDALTLLFQKAKIFKTNSC